MNKNDTTFLSCLGAIGLLIILVPLSIIMHGWVSSIMWGWFIVPLFGLPVLTIPYAIGISAVAALFKGNSSTNKDDNKSATTKFLEALFVAFVSPLISLGFGWIVLQFIH
jgi:hypothetical protein